MSVFEAYSMYYNLLYKDKDYEGETEYIINLLKKNNTQLIDILDLGCGTGRHDYILAQKGYRVHGVDLSEDMLLKAQQLSQPNSLSFSHGDIRKFKVEKKFDAVISLFHVISYQTQNIDLIDAFSTAAYHLDKGGVFVFDFWYGPAVLTQKPETRIKELEDDNIYVRRLATPNLCENKNIVEDAKSLGKNIIVSDINVHIEQKDERTVVFPKLDYKELSKIMVDTLQSPKDDDSMKENNIPYDEVKQRACEYGQQLYSFITDEKE